ncbi:hypothetical protein A2994_01805 [candidate division Kazan bacterium RIFCSPLOWO2_01_FULL_48_13]|uniref:Aminoglycoside phosphotransferase domain-containing protein n=1 Tax=candidate division Kazan bacterium RIFCSPLOWO2_01_FULL_48_13 TaxID=1798539 RepID=A0A1F4PNT8_UNCK3|nr:MAG: hypothetical protein A2994_01805 [candidate division Kazan bacterium RIFCSPLOWO2_01_FULL_48_13]
MIERWSQLSPLDQLCDELGVRPSARFTGGEKIDLNHNPVGEFSAGDGIKPKFNMFLVEDSHRTKFNLKIGNFNDREAEQTNHLRQLATDNKLFRVPQVKREEPGRYILFEHLKGMPVSREKFWKQPDLMEKVFETLSSIDGLLNQAPLEKDEADNGREWVAQKLSNNDEKGWIKPILADAELTRSDLINENFIDQVQTYTQRHQSELNDMVRIWRDPNGDHLIVPYDSLEHRMGVVDIDITTRPRHYVPMRFLAWTLLKIDDEKLSLETWVNQIRAGYGLTGADKEPTFVLSLTGILYDLATGERDNKNKRLIAVEVKNIINQIIKLDESR